MAAHFGKLHKNVIRAIQNLEIPDDYRRLNFELTINRVPGPKGALRDEPMYHITRDGFALLAMGFTGKEAMRWKVAYITTFNAMEAKLRALYVAPLYSQKEFRNGIKLRSKMVLMKQSRSTMAALVQETNPMPSATCIGSCDRSMTPSAFPPRAPNSCWAPMLQPFLRMEGLPMAEPRFIRVSKAPAYLAMDRNRFTAEVRPHLTGIPIGKRGKAFDRLELDAWANRYKESRGRPSRTEKGAISCELGRKASSLPAMGAGASISAIGARGSSSGSARSPRTTRKLGSENAKPRSTPIGKTNFDVAISNCLRLLHKST